MIRVKVFQEGELLQTIDLASDDITIGRESSAEIQLPSDAVSRRHARLRHTDEGWEIADLGAANGVFLVKGGGQPERVVLEKIAPGDVIVIEKFSIRFKEIQGFDAPTSSPAVGVDDGFTNKRTQFISMVELLDKGPVKLPALSMEGMPVVDEETLGLEDAEPRSKTWWARMISASGHDRTFRLDTRQAFVGTDSDCAIRLPSGPGRLVSLDRDGPTVSFERLPRWPFPRVLLHGRGAKAGLLEDGDSIVVGDVEITVHLKGEPERH